jgi:RHS repeat-associated protein
LLDHLNTVRGLVTTDGMGLTFLGYDAYGRALNPIAVPLFGFAGCGWNAGVGLYSNRARWLDPNTGRFVSQDPIGIAGGLNRYEYALGNPNHYTDPNGQFPWLLLGLVAGGFIAGGVVGGSSIRNDGVHLGWSWRGAAIGAGLALGGYAMAGYGIGALSATTGRLIAQGGMGIMSARAIYEGYTSGPPGTGESFIPFWGSARQFGHDLSRGSGWAVLSGLGTVLDLLLVGSIYNRLTMIAVEQNIRTGYLQLFRAAMPNFARIRMGVYWASWKGTFHTTMRVKGWGGPVVQVEALGGYGLKHVLDDLLAGNFRQIARNFLPMVTGRGGPFVHGRTVDAVFEGTHYHFLWWVERWFSVPFFVPHGRLAALGVRTTVAAARNTGQALIRSMSCFTSTITSFSAGWYHLPYMTASRGGYLGMRSIFE